MTVSFNSAIIVWVLVIWIFFFVCELLDWWWYVLEIVSKLMTFTELTDVHLCVGLIWLKRLLVVVPFHSVILIVVFLLWDIVSQCVVIAVYVCYEALPHSLLLMVRVSCVASGTKQEEAAGKCEALPHMDPCCPRLSSLNFRVLIFGR